MKKFITILMCLNLVMAPVAFAQTTAGGEASEQFVENQNAKKEKSGGMEGQILALAQSIAGTQVIMCSPKSPSMLIYLAGSIAYIASETLGAKAHVEQLKKKAADVKMLEEKMRNNRGGGEVQKEALEQALKEQKDSRDFVKKRKTWLTAISAIYMAATAAALMENLGFLLPPSTCAVNSASGITLAKGLSFIYSMGVAKASGGGIVSMAPALMLVIPGATAKVAGLMKLAPTRPILYALSAGFVVKAMSELSQKEKYFKENITLLEKSIKEFEAASSQNNSVASDASTSGSTAGSTSGSSDGSNGSATLGTTAGSSGVNSGVVSTLPTVQDRPAGSQCFTQTSEGMQYSEAACTKPYVMQVPTFDASIAVPTLTSATQAATRMANALSAGNMGAAEVEAGTLGTMAGRLSQIRDSLIKKSNADLVAKGKKPIDYDAESKSLMSELEKSGGFGSSTASSNGTGSSGSAGSSMTSSDGEELDPNKTSGNETMKINTAGTDTAVGVPTSGAETSGVDAISEEALLGSSGASSNVATKEASLSKKLGQYESNESDISDDTDFSIFKQVSNRYLLNYPKIFEKKLDQPQRK